MLKIDLHTHTIASGHAINTVYELAKEASKKGVKVLGIADHGPKLPGSANEMYFEILYRAPRRIFGIKVLYGIELNIIDYEGRVDLSEKYFKNLDFLSAGIHVDSSLGGGSEGEYTRATIKVMENKDISIFTHAYLLKRPTDIEKIAQAACDNHKLLEISTTHFECRKLNEECFERLTEMIKVVKKNKSKILLSSDAHFAHEIGIDKGLRKNMKKLGLTEKDIANNDIRYLRKFVKNI